MQRSQHAKRYPLFLGQPSPALAKIQRMPLRELRAYTGRLTEEIGHVRNKIALLRSKEQVSGGQVAGLQRLLIRLEALRVEADRRLGRRGRYEAR